MYAHHCAGRKKSKQQQGHEGQAGTSAPQDVQFAAAETADGAVAVIQYVAAASPYNPNATLPLRPFVFQALSPVSAMDTAQAGTHASPAAQQVHNVTQNGMHNSAAELHHSKGGQKAGHRKQAPQKASQGAKAGTQATTSRPAPQQPSFSEEDDSDVDDESSGDSDGGGAQLNGRVNGSRPGVSSEDSSSEESDSSDGEEEEQRVSNKQQHASGAGRGQQGRHHQASAATPTQSKNTPRQQQQHHQQAGSQQGRQQQQRQPPQQLGSKATQHAGSRHAAPQEPQPQPRPQVPSYERLPALCGAPEEGQVLAYRLLELDASMTPQVGGEALTSIGGDNAGQGFNIPDVTRYSSMQPCQPGGVPLYDELPSCFWLQNSSCG